MHIINRMYMGVEIQNSKTLAHDGRQCDRPTAPPPVLSPHSSHCALITAKNKFGPSLINVVISFFFVFFNCESLKLLNLKLR
jgi:hypothetical protein